MFTRRIVLAGLSSLPLAGTLGSGWSFAQEGEVDRVTTSKGDLLIHPVSHASLVLEWDGQVIYVDPVGGAELYEGLPKPTGILITHGHGDHFDVPTLQAIGDGVELIVNPAVYELLGGGLKVLAKPLANGEAGEIASVPVRAVPAYNTSQDRLQYHPQGVGNGYVLSFGDAEVYIAGDTEPTPEMLALTNIAVAFLPMNLPYTMTPDQAVEALNSFKPRIVYPYHYGKSDLTPLQTGLDAGIELRLRDWYAKG